jgi:hypothetical protein
MALGSTVGITPTTVLATNVLLHALICAVSYPLLTELLSNLARASHGHVAQVRRR